MFVKFTTLTSGKLACHTGCRSLSRYVPMTLSGLGLSGAVFNGGWCDFNRPGPARL